MKKALCIGVNYAGTGYALAGCINDADSWAAFLGKRGFDVAVLAEKAADRANVFSGMQRLAASLTKGDVGCVTFSGHGTWVPDGDGDEPDGRDEALVPFDAGDNEDKLILDDELKAVFASIADGAYLVFISDCCHSGSVFRAGPAREVKTPRFLPPEHYAGTDATALARVAKARDLPVNKSNVSLPRVIHFSGCRDVEYSYDAKIAGRACGAFSHFAVAAFEAVPEGTYSDVHKLVRKSLPSAKYPQTPQLNALSAVKRMKAFVA